MLFVGLFLIESKHHRVSLFFEWNVTNNIRHLHAVLVITITVFYYPQTGYALEPAPPFLLIEKDSSRLNTSATDSTECEAATTQANCPQTEHDLEPEPPFLLIEEDSFGLNTSTTSSTKNEEIPILNTNPERLNNDITNDEEPDEFICENMEVATTIASPAYFSFLDSHQKLISSYLHKTILSIDNFFATNQAINESTGSYMRLTLETFWPEGQGAEFNGSINIRAQLPGIKEKYRLVVESDPVEQQDSIEQESRQRSPDPATEQNRGVYTGVEKSTDKLGWNVKPSLGVKIRSPLDYYARLRLNRSDYFQKWALYLNERLYWFDSSGFGSDSTMRWDRPLHQTLLFRTTSFLRYTNETKYYDFSQTAEIIHSLNRKSAITYKVGVFGDTKNSVLAKTYLTSLLYRNNIHSDYLFLDLQPQIFFVKENNFEPRYEFLIRIEIYYRD